MPGQYNFEDFFLTMLKKPQLSSMRAPPRQSLVDETNNNVNIAPGKLIFIAKAKMFAISVTLILNLLKIHLSKRALISQYKIIGI